MYLQSDSIAKLADALAKAQKAIKPAAKDSTNPHFGSKYADLASVWEACREPLADNGLALVQMPQAAEGGTVLVTRLLHTSGEWIESVTPLLIGEKSTMQTLGSALTYARRYGLAAMVGVVADEDDDGNTATATPAARTPYRKPAQATTGEDPKNEARRAIFASLTRINAITAGMPDEEKRAIAHRYASWALKSDVKSIADLSIIDLTEAASKIGALTAPISTN